MATVESATLFGNELIKVRNKARPTEDKHMPTRPISIRIRRPALSTIIMHTNVIIKFTTTMCWCWIVIILFYNASFKKFK